MFTSLSKVKKAPLKSQYRLLLTKPESNLSQVLAKNKIIIQLYKLQYDTVYLTLNKEANEAEASCEYAYALKRVFYESISGVSKFLDSLLLIE
jgi:hypothetical protein